MAIELGAAYISILPSTAKLAPAIREEIRKVEGEAARSGDRAGRGFGTRFKASLTRWAKGGLLAGATGVGLLGAAGLKTAADLEQSKIGFETMLGSAKEADRFLAQVKRMAQQTPFELRGLTQSSQKLLAFGFDVKEVIPTLTTLGDAAAGLGLGADGVDRLTIALGQIKAKGRVQGDEILQLTEAGIPAMKILQNELGLTADEYQKMQRTGKITAEKAIPALLNGMKNGTKGAAGETAKFGGLMEKQSHSLVGLFSNLKDKVFLGLAQAIDPLMPLIKDGLQSAIDGVGPAMTRLSKATATFAQGMKDGTGAGGAFVDITRTLWDTLSAAVKVGVKVTSFLNEHRPLVYGLAAGYVVLKAAIIAHTAAMKAQAAGGALAALKAWIVQTRIGSFVTKAWAATQWLLNAAMAANPLVLIIGGLVLLGAALFVAWKKSETFRAIVMGAFNGVKAAGAAVFNWLSNAVSNTIDFVRNHWRLILGILTGPIGAAVILIASNFGKIKSTISSAIKGAIGIVRGFPGKVRSLAGDFLSAGKHIGSKVISGIGSGLKSAGGFVKDLAGSIKDAVNSALHLPVKIHGPGPLPDFKIPAFAKGTNFAPGGTALVGEEGPELVELPRGSKVTPNHSLDSVARKLHASAPTSVAVSTPSRPARTEFVVTNWKTGEGYFREIAEDTINGEDAFAGTTRRMK